MYVCVYFHAHIPVGHGRPVETGFTSTEPAEIIGNSLRGKLDTLFVDEDRELRGTFDSKVMQITMNEQMGSCSEDLLDLAVINTLLHKGSVYVMKKVDLPNPEPMSTVLSGNSRFLRLHLYRQRRTSECMK